MKIIQNFIIAIMIILSGVMNYVPYMIDQKVEISADNIIGGREVVPIKIEPIIYDEDIDKLTAFLANDTTNHREYNYTTYNCVDFSHDLGVNLTVPALSLNIY